MKRNEWIPVIERLPDYYYILDKGTEGEISTSKDVLIRNNKGEIFTGRFIFSHHNSYWVETLDGDEIEGETHWMPLYNEKV